MCKNVSSRYKKIEVIPSPGYFCMNEVKEGLMTMALCEPWGTLLAVSCKVLWGKLGWSWSYTTLTCFIKLRSFGYKVYSKYFPY